MAATTGSGICPSRVTSWQPLAGGERLAFRLRRQSGGGPAGDRWLGALSGLDAASGLTTAGTFELAQEVVLGRGRGSRGEAVLAGDVEDEGPWNCTQLSSSGLGSISGAGAGGADLEEHGA